MRESNSTKYPIFLVHGVGYRDTIPLIKYWGRIPKILRRHGAMVHVSKIDSWGSCETNAAMLKKEMEGFLKDHPCDKVNIIAHSKGGLDARYMITKLNMADRTASLTTVCTPHRGSALADFVFMHFKHMAKIYSRVFDLYARIFGDFKPDSRRTLSQLTSSSMQGFNREIRDDPAVYYQSLAAQLKNGTADPLFLLSHRILSSKEGSNDGLVSVASAKWGEFKGVIGNGKRRKGVSHLEITDFKRKTISGFKIPEIYLKIVRELAERGC